MRPSPMAHLVVVLVPLMAIVMVAGVPLSRGAAPAATPPLPARVALLHAAPFAADTTATLVATIGGEDKVLRSDWSFGEQAEYGELPSGPTVFKLYAGSLQPDQRPAAMPAATATLPLEPGADYTLIALGGANGYAVELLVLKDDNSPPAPGFTAVRVVHGAPFDPDLADTTVDIVRENGQILPGLLGLTYKEARGPISLPAGVPLDVKLVRAGRPSDPPVVNLDPLTLESGQVLTIVAIGGVEGREASVVTLVATLRRPAVLRILHLAPFAAGPAPVQVRLNGKPLAQNLNYLQTLGPLTIAEGGHKLDVVVPGSPPTTVGTDLILARDLDYSAVLVGGPGGSVVLKLLPAVAGAPPGLATLRVYHGAPFAQGEAARLDLRDGFGIPVGGITGLAYGEERSVDLAPGTYILRFTSPGGGRTMITVPVVVLQAGDIVTVYAVGDNVLQQTRAVVDPLGQFQRYYLPLVAR